MLRKAIIVMNYETNDFSVFILINVLLEETNANRKGIEGVSDIHPLDLVTVTYLLEKRQLYKRMK